MTGYGELLSGERSSDRAPPLGNARIMPKVPVRDIDINYRQEGERSEEETFIDPYGFLGRNDVS